MNPSVSVVIPSYNGAAFIGEALDSVYRQTLRPREVVVADDASTDGTGDLVAALARTAPLPVRLLRLDKNSGGPARPLNEGVAHAAGDLIAVLDQDDVFLPDKLETQAAVLARHAEVAFVFSWCATHARPDQVLQSACEQELLGQAHGDESSYRLPGPIALALLFRRGNFVWGYPGFLFRRRDWQRKGGLEEGLRIASDYDFLCWLATQGDAVLLPRVQYLRREHAANLCHRRLDMQWDMDAVRARYLGQVRSLDHGEMLAEEMRERTRMRAWWLGRAGFPAAALRFHLLYGRSFGWDYRALRGLSLLPARWAASLIRRRPRADLRECPYMG